MGHWIEWVFLKVFLKALRKKIESVTSWALIHRQSTLGVDALKTSTLLHFAVRPGRLHYFQSLPAPGGEGLFVKVHRPVGIMGPIGIVSTSFFLVITT